MKFVLKITNSKLSILHVRTGATVARRIGLRDILSMKFDTDYACIIFEEDMKVFLSHFEKSQRKWFDEVLFFFGNNVKIEFDEAFVDDIIIRSLYDLARSALIATKIQMVIRENLEGSRICPIEVRHKEDFQYLKAELKRTGDEKFRLSSKFFDIDHLYDD